MQAKLLKKLLPLLLMLPLLMLLLPKLPLLLATLLPLLAMLLPLLATLLLKLLPLPSNTGLRYKKPAFEPVFFRLLVVQQSAFLLRHQRVQGLTFCTAVSERPD